MLKLKSHLWEANLPCSFTSLPMLLAGTGSFVVLVCDFKDICRVDNLAKYLFR